MTSPITIPGVGVPPINTGEYTSAEMKAKYDEYIKAIQDIFNQAGDPTAEDLKKLQDLMIKLRDLANTGTVQNGKTFYMDKNMLDGLKTVFETLNSMGLTIPETGPMPILSPSEIEVALLAMKTLKEYSLEKSGQNITFDTVLLNALKGSVGADKTLQAMLETDFVRGINADFSKKLSALEEKLQSTDKVLKQLKALQDLLNQVTVPKIEDYKMPPEVIFDIPYDLRMKIEDLDSSTKNNPTKLVEWVKQNGAKYTDMSKEYFSESIPSLPIAADLMTNGATLLKYREDLKKLIDELKAAGQDPTEEGTLANDLTKVLNTINDSYKSYDQLLAAALAKNPNAKPEDIINPNSPYFDAGVQGAFEKATYFWIADGRSKVKGDAIIVPGSTQNIISNGTTNAQYLGDELKDELRTQQSAYEEFQKLANSLMDALSKIIQKFAQGAAR